MTLKWLGTLNFHCGAFHIYSSASGSDLCVTISSSLPELFFMIFSPGKLLPCILPQKLLATRLFASQSLGEKKSSLGCSHNCYRNVNGFKMTIVLVTLFDGAVMACNFFLPYFLQFSHSETNEEINQGIWDRERDVNLRVGVGGCDIVEGFMRKVWRDFYIFEIFVRASKIIELFWNIFRFKNLQNIWKNLRIR